MICREKKKHSFEAMTKLPSSFWHRTEIAFCSTYIVVELQGNSISGSENSWETTPSKYRTKYFDKSQKKGARFTKNLFGGLILVSREMDALKIVLWTISNNSKPISSRLSQWFKLSRSRVDKFWRFPVISVLDRFLSRLKTNLLAPGRGKGQ